MLFPSCTLVVLPGAGIVDFDRTEGSGAQIANAGAKPLVLQGSGFNQCEAGVEELFSAEGASLG